MIDTIKTTIAKTHPLTESKGIFFSCFDKNKKLINSHGVAITDKPLDKVIDMIYYGLLEAQAGEIKSLICHLITYIEEITDVNKINTIDLTTYGLLVSDIDYTKSWVILPNTTKIDNIPQALQTLKTKHHIEWNIHIAILTCDTIEIKI